MNVEMMGVEMTPDVRVWDRDQRRVGSLAVFAAAAALLLIGAATFLLAREKAAALYWVFVVLLVILFAIEIAVFVFAMLASRAADNVESESDHAHADHAASARYGPAVGAPAPERYPEDDARVLTLRCGDCATEFDVTDSGERPLHHVCPGCGAEGYLNEELDAAPAAGPELEAEPEPVAEPEPYYGPPEESAYEEPEPAYAAPPPAYVPPPAPATTRLKLRCGGCREVFSMDDDGKRPLRRPCPHCGRIGEVR